MTYTILLTEDKKGHFHATVPSLPDCHAEAKTRSEANTIREAIITLMSRSAIHCSPCFDEVHLSHAKASS